MNNTTRMDESFGMSEISFINNNATTAGSHNHPNIQQEIDSTSQRYATAELELTRLENQQMQRREDMEKMTQQMQHLEQLNRLDQAEKQRSQAQNRMFEAETFKMDASQTFVDASTELANLQEELYEIPILGNVKPEITELQVAAYMERHDMEDIMEELLAMVIQHMPTYPFPFMISMLRKKSGAKPETNYRAALQESETRFQDMLNKTQTQHDDTLAEHDDALQTLQAELDQSTLKSESQLAKAHADLKRTKQDLDTELTNTRRLADEKRTVADQWRTEKTRLQQEKEGLLETTNKFNRTLKTLKDEMDQDRNDSEAKLKMIQQKAAQQTRNLEESLTQVREELNQANATNKNIQAEMELDQVSDKTEVARQLHQLQDENRQLQKDLQTKDKHVRDVDEKLQQSDSEIVSLQKQIRSDNNEVNDLKEQIDALQLEQERETEKRETEKRKTEREAQVAAASVSVDMRPPTPQQVVEHVPDVVEQAESPLPELDTLPYVIKVTTGQVNHAGTDASVRMKMFGDSSQTEWIKLDKSQGHRDKFEKGKSDVFHKDANNISDIKSIRIGHDKSGMASGWFLDSVLIQIPSLAKQFRFVANRWLSVSENDGKVEIIVERDMDFPMDMHEVNDSYTCSTFTGTESGASLDNATAFVQIYGEKTNSDEIELRNDDKQNFKNGKQDAFQIEFPEVGAIKKIRVWHNGQGVFGASWYLDRVELYDKKRQKTYAFEAGKWLDKKKGNVYADLPLTRTTMANNTVIEAEQPNEIVYEVTVQTGNEKDAGTDANVFIKLKGSKGDSGTRPLKNPKSNHFDKFERNRNDIFEIKCVDLGELSAVVISRDTKDLIGADWLVAGVQVKRGDDLQSTNFPCNEWLTKKKGLSRELSAVEDGPNSEFKVVKKGVEYTMTFFTSDIREAGTDSRVWIQLYGQHNETKLEDDSGKIPLSKSKENSDPFQRGSTDSYINTVNLANIHKIRVGHDNHREGLFTNPSWHLDRVELDAPSLGQKLVFRCEDWLASDKGDGLLEKTLFLEAGGNTEYKAKKPWQVEVFTSEEKNAGISSDVHATVFFVNDDGKQTPCELNFKDKANKNDFEKGAHAKFSFDLEDAGSPIKLTIGHNASGFLQSNKWHLEKVVLLNKEQQRFEFVFEDWIHSKVDMERPLATANRLSDGDGVVDIDDAGMLDLIPYIIRVKTADTDRAGTDAHISIKLGGKDGGESRFVELTKKNMASSNKDLFERGKTDEFKLQLVDIGSLGSVTLKSDGHRGAHLMYPTWELDSVVVVGRGATYQFNCNQTFGTKKSLGLEHKFEDPEAVVPTPASSRRSSLSKTKRKADNSNRTMHKTKQAPTEIKYIITTWTGTHKSASTDSNIEITLHGDKGTSAPFRLDKTINKRKDKFENGNDDIFREGPIPILGELTAVTLVSDNARGMGHMFSPDWLCDRVEVEEKMPGGKKYLFPNLQQRWMSKAKGLKMKLTVSAP